MRLGEYDKAQEMINRTLELAKQIRSLPVADLALLRGELGYVQARRKRYDEARRLLVQSLAELENSGRPLELAVISAYYGEFFANQGYWEQAIEQYERTLKLREQVLGKHPLTVTALLNCSDAFKNLYRKSEA
jgi:tetratricopeptide (TPR) repeat protein